MKTRAQIVAELLIERYGAVEDLECERPVSPYYARRKRT